MDLSVFQRRVFCLSLWLLCVLSAPAHAVFINEIHYDNAGGDSGEAIELAGAAGLDLAGWSLVLYNGSGGATDKTLDLGGIFTDMEAGFGTLSFTALGMQNGAPDGMALVDASNNVIQFLSYEGSFTATNGPALAMTSIDIGVSETSSTPIGSSLQLTGSGSLYADFTWALLDASTFEQINTGQTFVIPEAPNPNLNVSVPEPTSLYLLGVGLIGLGLMTRRRCANQNRWRLAGSAPVPV